MLTPRAAVTAATSATTRLCGRRCVSTGGKEERVTVTTVSKYEVFDHTCDALVIGAGGAGLRAAVGLVESGLTTACVTKVWPTRSHTVAAQGGINAALGNMGDGDHWHHHFFDTVKGSDWLGDQDAIHKLCKEAPEVVVELERYGLPFSRTESGRIYQRSFGGQTLGKGSKKLAKRTCACADRTGHAMLHTLYGQALRHGCRFFAEFQAIDLLRDPQTGRVNGALFMCLADGTFHRFHAQATVLATGGAGRCYATSTAGHPCTGDGNGMALRAGLPLEDMEFVQFHPTGLYKVGCLITEAVRGEGGYLINGLGERFMDQYAPAHRDLASRDVVSRSMAREIAAGRGCGPNRDHLLLSVHHLPARVIDERLPGIAETAAIFCNVDVHKAPIPVVPTAHYTMGGVPTTLHGQVRTAPNAAEGNVETVVPGLYAAGEGACVSVHGGNRLGANSLLETVVFGRTVAKSIAQELLGKSAGASKKPISRNAGEASIAKIDRLLSGRSLNGSGSLSVAAVRNAMQRAMEEHVGVFRTGTGLQKGIATLEGLWSSFGAVRLTDRTRSMNTELAEALELENMLMQSVVAAHSASNRQESRGAHAREDYPRRDDTNFLHHTLAWMDSSSGKVSLGRRPVHIRTLDPSELAPIPPSNRSY